MGLWYSKDSGSQLNAYADADHAGCHDDCKSRSGGIQFLRDKLVSWSSKKQDCTTMSTAEAKTWGSDFLRLLYALLNFPGESGCGDELFKFRCALNYSKLVIIIVEQPQQIILADQLITSKYQSIGRCNNYASWKTVKQVSNANETIRFMIDMKDITYTMDMFCSILKLPVEAPNHQFIASATLKYIQPFLKIVGYGGIVDKVSTFFTKNLAQPWQKMLKGFNRCLTSRTSGHDQTKINILQIFYAVIMRVHVDYASFLWWDSFTRLEEEYHYIKDDILLEYKDYVKDFVRVDVPTIQIQLVTQGANRTPRATRTPNLKDVQKKHVSTTPPPPSDDRKRYNIAEATLLSLTLLKMAKIAEEQENVAKVQEKILEEDIKIIFEGEYEESYAKIVNDDDVEENKDDDNDDDNDDHDDHALVRNKVLDSLEDRNEKMQTSILSPPRSLWTYLSLDKAISQELTATVSPTPATTSQDQSK
ncbi:hypothetical protein Tco_1561467 [Tanacetum coccineum]